MNLGNVSRTAQDRIGIDLQAPEGGAVLVNKGAKYCTDINKRVNIFLRVKSGTEMMIANDDKFRNRDWEKFKPFIQNWELDGEDGEKTIYVKFRDEAGNQTDPITAKIILDRQQPIEGEVVINNGAEYSTDRTQKVLLKIDAKDATEMMVAHDKFFRSPAKWQPYKKENLLGIKRWRWA